jgi:M6 family metalloprotease-like protein
MNPRSGFSATIKSGGTMKSLFCVILCLTAIAALAAAPLTMMPLDVYQPDGTALRIYASGDEFHNWVHDAENYTIVQNDEGYYRREGEYLVPTDLIAGRDHPMALQPGINISPSQLEQKYARAEAVRRNYGSRNTPTTGLVKNISIFIKFADDPDFNLPFSTFDDMLNSPAQADNSLKSFFLAVSYGQLEIDTRFFPAPHADVVVAYTDIYPRGYYQPYSASNPQGYPAGGFEYWVVRETELISRAVSDVEQQIATDLVIDANGDGLVDSVCFIVQGSSGAWAEMLWGHQYSLWNVNVDIHGIRISDYTLTMESEAAAYGSIVLKHEIFHTLGAPDLYRYYNQSISPVGAWDIMAYTGNPYLTTGAWMRYQYGHWTDPPPAIYQSGTYTLQPINTSASANSYRIPSWVANEFYILEYRKAGEFFDSNIPGSGLLVYRLNRNTQGNSNGPPDELFIYRPNSANNNQDGNILLAFLSAESRRKVINEVSTPSGYSSLNTPGGLNLYDVGFAGDTISFKVKISQIQLTAPYWGDAMISGTDKLVTWKAKNYSGDISVEYSADLGQNWIVITESTPNTGSYLWEHIPVQDSEQCQIRISLIGTSQQDSSTYPFSINSTLAVPIPLLPHNLATGVATNPLISWQSVSGATGYHFQLSSTPNFDSPTYNLITFPTASYLCSLLLPFTTYYWRVASVSGEASSMFCPVQSFCTGAVSEVPAVPNQISPPNFTTGTSITPTLSWQSVAQADAYRVQIATDGYFSTLVEEVQGITQNSWVPAPLLPNRIYYWRVGATNAAGNSNYSQIWRFTTGNGTALEENLLPALSNSLHRNFPNPFNPSTTISFSVKNPSLPIRLEIYNTRGQLLRCLYAGKPAASSMSLQWDGRDDRGKPCPSGVYLYRLSSQDFCETLKLLMLK